MTRVKASFACTISQARVGLDRMQTNSQYIQSGPHKSEILLGSSTMLVWLPHGSDGVRSLNVGNERPILHGCHKMAGQLLHKFTRLLQGCHKNMQNFLVAILWYKIFARQPHECLMSFVHSLYKFTMSEDINARGSANSCHIFITVWLCAHCVLLFWGGSTCSCSWSSCGSTGS